MIFNTSFLWKIVFVGSILGSVSHHGDVGSRIFTTAVVSAEPTEMMQQTHYLLKTNALNYFENHEIDTEIRGNCENGNPKEEDVSAPDAQTTNRAGAKPDSRCTALGPCHIGFTQAGEWVSYKFYHTDDDIQGYDVDGVPIIKVNVTLRVAAETPRLLYLEMVNDGNELGASQIVHTSSSEYDEWEDVTWENASLEPYNPHALYVFFAAGNTNLCSVAVSVNRPSPRKIPLVVNALDYDDANEVDTTVMGNCDTGAPPIDEADAQNTNDEECEALGPCHVAFTQAGEWVEYHFDHENEYVVDLKDGGSQVFVDITVRVASEEVKEFGMELSNGYTSTGGQTFKAPGRGWQEYEDVVWRMVPLETREGTHTLHIVFYEGNVNLCKVSVVYSRYTPPITFTANDYFWAIDSSPSDQLGGCNPRDDGVDIQPTTDPVCLYRDGSECNVAFTEPGEVLQYRFYVSSIDEDDYDIWIRASILTRIWPKQILVELNPVGREGFSKTIDIVSRQQGYQFFSDHVWENFYLEENEYILTIYFLDGQINLCSVSVLPSTSRYHLFVPGTYSALLYADNLDNTPERIGDCPIQRQFGAVDALVVDDRECESARSNYDATCAIGWTDEDEFVTYQFQTDGLHEYVDISFRVSSNSSQKRFIVEYPSFEQDPQYSFVYGPGRGWDKYETKVWKNVYVGAKTLHELSIRWVEGKINLCSIGFEYSDK